MIDTKESTPVMTLTQAAAYLQVSKAHLSNVINGKVAGRAAGPQLSVGPPYPHQTRVGGRMDGRPPTSRAVR